MFSLLCGSKAGNNGHVDDDDDKMGHECIWQTAFGRSGDEGRGKEKILMGEEDGNMVHIYI
jgi:hypothetical protein